MKKIQISKGFTLIELLVVIAVVGILAIGLIALINPAQQIAKARDSTRKSHLKQINDALERYKTLNGQYPPAGACALGTNCYVFSTAGSNWIPDLVARGELKTVPVDPINNTPGPWEATDNYTYAYGNVCANGDCYDLTARLENHNDLDRCEIKQYKWYDSSLPSGSGAPFSWCGGYSKYIYEVSP